MTEIEQKALSLLNEVNIERNEKGTTFVFVDRSSCVLTEALCRAIEQHDAFKRDVSDAVAAYNDLWRKRTPGRDEFIGHFIRFILPKPDKQLRSIAADRLVYAASEYFCNRKNNLELIDAIVELAASAALAKGGLEVREIEG